MKPFKLGEEVIVSDPCYEVPTWCQVIVKKVTPGNYVPFVKKTDNAFWGRRVSMLMSIHQDYLNSHIIWKKYNGTVGVDSGQAGIFSKETYRVNGSARKIQGSMSGFFNTTEPGEQWYEQMCNRTLGDKGWGQYKEGVVSRSGLGDGSYDLFVGRVSGKIVGFCIDFQVEESKYYDFGFYKKEVKLHPAINGL